MNHNLIQFSDCWQSRFCEWLWITSRIRWSNKCICYLLEYQFHTWKQTSDTGNVASRGSYALEGNLNILKIFQTIFRSSANRFLFETRNQFERWNKNRRDNSLATKFRIVRFRSWNWIDPSRPKPLFNTKHEVRKHMLNNYFLTSGSDQ